MKADLLKTKKHFRILDGLRGVAALAVVIFHFVERVILDYSKNFIGHGFLAVDFFFCLSGFVIAYAYDDRLIRMGLWEFFKSRLIRLHPLIILGAVLGLLAFLLDPFSKYHQLYDSGTIALLFISSLVLIPYPLMEERSFSLFEFNGPAWSLFWEYAANVAYALALYRLGRRPLLLLTILSAVFICISTYRYGDLSGGWGGANFHYGAVRVCYSFLAGLLVYRSGWIIKNNLGFIGLSVLLFLSFVMPYSRWNWLTEPIVVIFYFPFLVALGAGATLKPGLGKLCEFSGKISYPLYMTHYWAIWVFLNYFRVYKPDTIQLTVIIITGTALLIGFAYLMMAVYDIPVRRYLTKIRKQEAR